jgi:hypothetical protein
MDTGQPKFTVTPRGQPLTWMVTIDDAMHFQFLISGNAELSLMSLAGLLDLVDPHLKLNPGATCPRA